MGVIGDFMRAAGQMFDARFTGVLLRAVAMTLGLLVAASLGAVWLVGLLPESFDLPWIGAVATPFPAVRGLALGGMAVLSAFLMFPVAAMFVNLYLDRIADGLVRFLLRHPDAQFLPRKFKIAFSGCASDCAYGAIHDLGFLARRGPDGERVFKVVAGGGLATHPTAAITIEDRLPAALATRCALAVVRGLLRVLRGQAALRPRNRTEMLGDQRERARRVEAPGDDQHRVVGLVPVAVEGLQPPDRHALDVRARADDRVAVVVPGEREALHALVEDRARAVLAHLELVAHDCHLAVEIGLRDEGIHHPVGFHADRPGEIVVGRGERLVVVGAVERGRAVPARTARLGLLLDVAVALRALEQQMLEQVRHALFTVAFVARADQVGDMHCDRVCPRRGNQQDAQAVV